MQLPEMQDFTTLPRMIYIANSSGGLPNMNITFQKLTTPEEMEQLLPLQAAVWSTESAIPHHMTLTLAKFGGLFIGAYDDHEMIGFLYSFPGFTNGESHLCSHMMGFLPSYRKHGLGVKMKWLQQEEALQLGHTKITWTYDPLETVNGYLNLVKLGGVVRSYYPNCYGPLNDEFNRGLPTDRFLVDWYIDSKRVHGYRNGQIAAPVTDGAPHILQFTINDGLPSPEQMDLDRQESVLLLPVPAHFQEVKRADMVVAAAWRDKTRTLFQTYFARGYTTTHLIRSEEVVYYVLENRPLQDVLDQA